MKSKFSKEVLEAADNIGHFYLEKHGGDVYAANQEIERVRINNLSFEDGALVIETSRPGILIGKRGENIKALQERLGSIKITETRETITDYIYRFAFEE